MRCRDGSLYTGITSDLARRLRLHDAGGAAGYGRGRGPVTLVHVERRVSKGAALRREAAIKRLTRTKKRSLCGDAP